MLCSIGVQKDVCLLGGMYMCDITEPWSDSVFPFETGCDAGRDGVLQPYDRVRKLWTAVGRMLQANRNIILPLDSQSKGNNAEEV